MTTQNTPDPKPSQSAATQAKVTASDVTEQAKSAARDVAQNAASAAKDQAETAKSSVADEMSGVASALRTAAEEMRSGSPQERTFGQIAEGLADASEAMRDRDLSEMVQDVSAFARKNPLVFLGGAALIGFAATRFAKASNAPNQQTTLHTPGTERHGDFS
ncbi:hypothetical protein [Actibacterium sp. 188UL27-1]|uniref:hypothetical protein n=1 Tax=Actibacterium sp. 188UL27-1 TaxID=2786961 RepID=UPI001957C66A|nr:hypothetical protein [Actibacterium sp. 188UL27-1]MBM7070080.1 hypothetical protein [Actibacterium sp. 188UL27-1]